MKPCFGGHQQVGPMPCHVTGTSCGSPCGKELDCQHRCQSKCHSGDCPPCKQQCGRPRIHCAHVCSNRCHPGEACPDEPCSETVPVTCKCGRRREMHRCNLYSGRTQASTTTNLTCTAACNAARTASASSFTAARDKYSTTLLDATMSCRRFMSTVEGKLMEAVDSRSSVSIIGCNSPAKKLAVMELASVHFRMDLRVKEDGTALALCDESRGCRKPAPLLSEILDSRPSDNVVDIPRTAPKAIITVASTTQTSELFRLLKDLLPQFRVRREEDPWFGTTLTVLCSSQAMGAQVNQRLAGSTAPVVFKKFVMENNGGIPALGNMKAPLPKAMPRPVISAARDAWGEEDSAPAAVVEKRPVLSSWEDH